jgi:hypothetical protein
MDRCLSIKYRILFTFYPICNIIMMCRIEFSGVINYFRRRTMIKINKLIVVLALAQVIGCWGMETGYVVNTIGDVKIPIIRSILEKSETLRDMVQEAQRQEVNELPLPNMTGAQFNRIVDLAEGCLDADALSADEREKLIPLARYLDIQEVVAELVYTKNHYYRVDVKTASTTDSKNKKTIEQLLKRIIKYPEGSAERPIEFTNIKTRHFDLLTSLLEKKTNSELVDFVNSLELIDVEPLINLVKSFNLTIFDQFMLQLRFSGKLAALAQAKNKLFIDNATGGAIIVQWAIRDEEGRVHEIPARPLDYGAPAILIGPIGKIMYVRYAAHGKFWGLTSTLWGWNMYSREDLNSQQLESVGDTDITMQINSPFKKPIIVKTAQVQREEAAVALKGGEYPANAFLRFFDRVNSKLLNIIDDNEYSRIPDMDSDTMDKLLKRELSNRQLKWHHFLVLSEDASAEDINARYEILLATLPEGDDKWIKLAKSYLLQARDNMLDMLKQKQTWGQWTGWSK